MMLADYLLTLPSYALVDIYDTLYQPGVRVSLSDIGYRTAITEYWEEPAHWKELLDVLSPTERQMMTRLALHEHCKINAFMEALSDLGLLILHRERNRYDMPDDVRTHLLEHLPSLRDRLQAHEVGDADGTAPV